MAEGTYEEIKGREVRGPGILEEFRVDVGLRQRRALSPMLFIEVVQVISRKRVRRTDSASRNMQTTRQK